MDRNSFLLGAVLGEMHGNHPGAWRMPAADPNAYTDVTAFVRAARPPNAADWTTSSSPTGSSFGETSSRDRPS
jgi:hypothetical protein